LARPKRAYFDGEASVENNSTCLKGSLNLEIDFKFCVSKSKFNLCVSEKNGFHSTERDETGAMATGEFTDDFGSELGVDRGMRTS
jgi:hypothetical protein